MSQKYEYDEKTKSYVPVDDEKTSQLKNDDERIIGIVLWAIQFLNSTLWPLVATIIAYVYFKDKSNFLSDTAKELLNFQISLIIYAAISGILIFVVIGIPMLILVGVYSIVIPILGILEALNMKVYKGPFIIKFIQ